MLLNVKMLARAIGMTWAAGIILLGIVGWFGYGEELVAALSSIYVGYDVSFMWIIIGGAWALFDWMIAGALIAYFYNLWVSCDSKKKS